MTEKEIFEIVKYFKSIYTTINNKTEKLLISNNYFYYEADPHFLMFGKMINQENNVFLNWSNDKIFDLNFKDVDNLRSCLKKNVVSVDLDNTKFVLKYKDKEEVEQDFLCSKKEISDSDKIIINKINIIKSLFKNQALFAYNDFINKEIIELYIKEDGTVSEERSADKIIEIPFKRVQSLIKDSDIIVKFSNKDDEGKRYVMITSSNDLLELSQIFATI